MALVDSHSTATARVRGRDSAESRGSTHVAIWLRRCRESTWAPLALRALGIVLGMASLAAIGAFASAQGVANGYAVEGTTAGSAPSASSAAISVPQSREWLDTRADRAAVAAVTGPPAQLASAPSASARSQKQPLSPGMTEDGKVILNLATADDLTRLPGVGRKRADAILALRAKLGGRFKRVSDLLRIRGIGPRRLQQLIPLVVLDAPAPATSPSAASSAGPPKDRPSTPPARAP